MAILDFRLWSVDVETVLRQIQYPDLSSFYIVDFHQ